MFLEIGIPPLAFHDLDLPEMSQCLTVPMVLVSSSRIS